MTGPVEAYMIHDYAEARRRLHNGTSKISSENNAQLILLVEETRKLRADITILQHRIEELSSPHFRNTPLGPIGIIINMLTKHENITKLDLLSERRTKHLVYVRHMGFWLCRECTKRSLPEIGRLFGGRDHTTVMNGCDKISRLIQEDAVLARRLDWYQGQFKRLTADTLFTKAPECLLPAEPLEEFEGSKSERPLATAL